jgi:tetratricopeptide (TPR) repeat protein
MLADLVGVTASTVRRWHRRGILHAAREVRRLAFFDFTEVTVARRLAELVAAGCSLRAIERKLEDLARQMPDVARPLAELPLVVEGKRLLVRRGDDLSEPGGQLLLDFEPASEAPESRAISDDRPTVAISIETARLRLNRQPGDETRLPTAEEMLAAAVDFENDGALAAAAEMYRAVLIAGPTADANFLLADVLYRLGDLTAARERYYAAIELDETFVEARANLGCVLAESGEPELAIAAFEGALALEADYPDVHFHLARTLDAIGRKPEAEAHWQTFLSLAPDSPWADEAEARLGDSAQSS